MKKNKNELLRELRVLYYIVYSLVIVLLGIVLFMNYNAMKDNGEAMQIFEPNSSIGMSIQYAAILYTLCAIPGVLYWFKRQCLKLSTMEDEDEKYNLYYRYARMRAAIIASTMFVCLVAYTFLGAYNPMIWLTAIGALAFVFCKPTERKAEEELRPKDDTPNY